MIERAVPIGKREKRLWKQWEKEGVSKRQRSELLGQYREQERKKKELERQKNEDAMKDAYPKTPEEMYLWDRWMREGNPENMRLALLRSFREHQQELEAQQPSPEEQAKAEREANIIIFCLFGIPFILVVLAIYIFISKPMILLCIIWAIGTLIALALG